jgi:L,D-transpeptidase YcbB
LNKPIAIRRLMLMNFGVLSLFAGYVHAAPLKASISTTSLPIAPLTSAPTPESLVPVLVAVASNPEPMYGPRTYERSAEAYRFYETISEQGGWKALPNSVTSLKIGSRGALVIALKARLKIENDIGDAFDDIFDSALSEAIKKFQLRHGFSATGLVGPLSLKALNVPVHIRLNQLAASLHRLNSNGFKFSDRYVVVNIPGAAVEAVDNGQVAQRHLAVVGRPDRPSPVLEARIQAVNFNPTWTVPTGIIKNDIMPKVRKDSAFLFKNNMRVLNAAGEEIDPNSVDWSGKHNPNFTLRQDGGAHNSLGQVRIDMPNTEAVYLHDTPKKELFKSDVRFHSSGCARVENVRDLASWLLKDTQFDRTTIDVAISTDERLDIKLPKSVPVAWVYMTAWASSDGSVQFRDDIYKLDTPDGIVTSTIKQKIPKSKTSQKTKSPQ